MLERAESLCRESLEHCVRLAAPQAITYGKVNLGYILGQQRGKIGEARRLLTEAISECAAVGNLRLEGWARAHLSTVERVADDGAAAEEHARRAVDLLSVSPGLRAWALAAHGRALLLRGRAEDALAQARESMRILEDLGGILQGESIPPLALAEALAATGDAEGARAALADARTRLERRADRLGNPEWRRAFLALPDNERTLALVS